MHKEICIFVDLPSSSLCIIPLSTADNRVLARTYTMIDEILAYETQIISLKGSSNEGVKSNVKNNSEIDRLTKELEKKDRDLQTLKSQAAGNNKAYDDLADQHAKATARTGEGKKDL
jgi:B-cell receptor-associated protein 31